MQIIVKREFMTSGNCLLNPSVNPQVSHGVSHTYVGECLIDIDIGIRFQ